MKMISGRGVWRTAALLAAFLVASNVAPPGYWSSAGPALAQLAAPPGADGSVQLDGSLVVIRPASGLKAMPGSSMMVGRPDGMGVFVQPSEAGLMDGLDRLVRTPEWQKKLGLTDVTVTTSPTGAYKRIFLTGFGVEAAGTFRKHMLLIDNGVAAASVISAVPRKAYDADPGVDDEMRGMLETVRLADKLPPPSALGFKLTVPQGFEPLGGAGGQTQVFLRSDNEVLVVIREAKPAPLERLEIIGKAATRGMVDKQLRDATVISETRARSGDWEYFEQEAKGIHVKTGAPAVFLTRVQIGKDGNSYIVMAGAICKQVPDGWQGPMRKTFESIVAAK
jgi:hypothetical protein